MNHQLGKVVCSAQLYETAAWGKTDQNAFLNTCVMVKTFYSPKMCFNIIKSIEKQVGRKKNEHWGPREIDIDILLYNSLVIDMPELTVPHAQMHNRNFVLKPSSDIASRWVHPLLKKTIKRLLNECEDNLTVKQWRS